MRRLRARNMRTSFFGDDGAIATKTLQIE
jgi:hypothetical protein